MRRERVNYNSYAPDHNWPSLAVRQKPISKVTEMTLFSGVPTDAILINRLDPNEILGTCSEHGFQLEDLYWPSVEHYYQAAKYQNPLKEKIRTCEHPLQARKIGRSIFKRKRADWKNVRNTLMTRAVYTKCRAHQEVAEALLETGSKPLADNNFGEYYWGIGRDGRGMNNYGKVLQNVRDRLHMEAKNATPTTIGQTSET